MMQMETCVEPMRTILVDQLPIVDVSAIGRAFGVPRTDCASFAEATLWRQMGIRCVKLAGILSGMKLFQAVAEMVR